MFYLSELRTTSILWSETRISVSVATHRSCCSCWIYSSNSLSLKIHMNYVNSHKRISSVRHSAYLNCVCGSFILFHMRDLKHFFLICMKTHEWNKKKNSSNMLRYDVVDLPRKVYSIDSRKRHSSLSRCSHTK